MKKKITFMCIMGIMLLSNTLLVSQNVYAKAKTNKDTPGSAIFVMALPTEISIDSKEISYSKDNVTINIKYPEIKGLHNHKFEKILNNYFKNNSTKAKRDLIQEVKSYHKEDKLESLPHVRYELIQNFRIKETINGYFAIELFEYTYTGGSHGLATQKYLMIDVVNNKIVMLKDLFKETADYTNEINTIIKKQMVARREDGEYFFEGSNEFESINDQTQFYVNNKGDLVIVFNLYEIAPYASGILKFNIPKNNLPSYKINE